MGEVLRRQPGRGSRGSREAPRRGTLRPLLLLGAAARHHPRAGAREHAPLRLRGGAQGSRSGEVVKAASEVLSQEQIAFLARRRVARLATADGAGEPHVVPVCFAYSAGGIFVALDEKPKDVPQARLKRVRNILENPRVALVVDRYAEDWRLLAFVIVRGQAGLLRAGEG